MLIAAAILLLSALLGVLIHRASSCGVSAVKTWVLTGRADAVVGLGLAAGGAAAVSLLWEGFGGGATMEMTARLAVLGLLGAAGVGVGAVINGACLLGSIARLGNGELRFLAIFPGLALGFGVADFAMAATQAGQAAVLGGSAAITSPLAPPGGARLVVVLATLALAAFWPFAPNGAKGAWSMRWAMPLLGVVGGCLYALQPGWTYSDAIHGVVRAQTTMMSIAIRPLALLSIAALAVGAVLSGRALVGFAWRAADLRGWCASFAGAVLMGIGGAFAGGGNDHLIFWALPHLQASALVAYTVMTGTIALLVFTRHRRHVPA